MLNAEAKASRKDGAGRASSSPPWSGFRAPLEGSLGFRVEDLGFRVSVPRVFLGGNTRLLYRRSINDFKGRSLTIAREIHFDARLD